MSKIVSYNEGRDNSCFVETNDGKLYYIDSCWTMDHGYETMVFAAEKSQLDGEYNVTSWNDLYVNIYSDYDKMKSHHEWLTEHLEFALAEEE